MGAEYASQNYNPYYQGGVPSGGGGGGSTNIEIPSLWGIWGTTYQGDGFVATGSNYMFAHGDGLSVRSAYISPGVQFKVNDTGQLYKLTMAGMINYFVNWSPNRYVSQYDVLIPSANNLNGCCYMAMNAGTTNAPEGYFYNPLDPYCGYDNEPSWPLEYGAYVTDYSSGRTATGTSSIGGGIVLGVTLSNNGSGYLSAPAVTFSAAPAGGTTATGHTTIADGAVTEVVVDSGGTGYVTAPTVTIAPPVASGGVVWQCIGSVALLYFLPILDQDLTMGEDTITLYSASYME
jgi:hypothetical protein